jgi:hypothetical protein
MSETELQTLDSVPTPTNAEELFRAPVDPNEQPWDDGSGIRPRKGSSRVLMLLLGVIAMAACAVLVLSQKGLKSATPNISSAADDLGAGISQASGLRGHLVTRWQGKAQYMLKIEPLDPRDAEGFAAVTANPSKPISIDIRLIDSAGFALCGKEIVLPSMKQNQVQTNGADVFTNILGSDGKVEALWAQGDLPCSPDQYQRFDYWDLTTNFPILAEQDALLGRKPAVQAAETGAAAGPVGGPRGRRKPVVKAPVSTFYVEGDDQLSMYEASRHLLTDDSGRSFFIAGKSDQTIAANWAANYSHIHFKCDQHANCALRTGSGEILGRMSN